MTIGLVVKAAAVKFGIPALKYGGPAVMGYVVGRNKDAILSRTGRMTSWIGRLFTSKEKLAEKAALIEAATTLKLRAKSDKEALEAAEEATARAKFKAELEASILEKVNLSLKTAEVANQMHVDQVVSEVRAEVLTDMATTSTGSKSAKVTPMGSRGAGILAAHKDRQEKLNKDKARKTA